MSGAKIIGHIHHQPPEQRQRHACTEHPARQIAPAVAEAHPAGDKDQHDPEAEQQGADGLKEGGHVPADPLVEAVMPGVKPTAHVTNDLWGQAAFAHGPVHPQISIGQAGNGTAGIDGLGIGIFAGSGLGYGGNGSPIRSGSGVQAHDWTNGARDFWQRGQIHPVFMFHLLDQRL